MNSTIILFGGRSSERLVSVASGQNVSRLLPEAQLWFQSKTGAVFQVSASDLAAHLRPFENEFHPAEKPHFSSLESAIESIKGHKVTLFLALHGGEGENGTLQARLEQNHVAFTGSGSIASANAFDKALAKQLVAPRGVKLAAAQILEPGSASALEKSLTELMSRHARWVLKPVADGSSYGLVHLKSSSEIKDAAQTLATASVRYLAEQYIAGRELTVGVFDSEQGLTALPVSEVRLAANGAFDYAGKYLGKGTEEITPAVLTPTEWSAAQALAVTSHQAIGCYGYTRTDMILTSDGPVFLETNTLPGLTKASFIPQQLAAANLPFKLFLERQLHLAEHRP